VSDDFDLKKLMEYIPRYQKNASFRDWVRQSHWCILKEFQSEKKELLDNRLSYRFIFNRS